MKPAKLKYMRKQRASVVEGSKIQTGQCKVNKGQKIFKKREEKEMKAVPMHDAKGTIKFVDLDDPRSNEEIRSAWKEEQEKKLRSLAS